MGLFDKLKDILFDEETVEIPVITKEDEEELALRKEPVKLAKKEEEKEEVRITKIDTSDEDYISEMPKLKEEKPASPVKTSNFSFPLFDDDDDVMSMNEKPIEKVSESKSRIERELEEYDFRPKRRSELLEEMSKNKNVEFEKPRETISNKEKSRFSIDSNNTTKKPFTLSPIISPVYGVLNEDYRKEDIVTKGERKMLSQEKLDLDTVRKKAYGTLEDDIEEYLDKASSNDVLDEVPDKEDISLNDLPEDGLSVNDLLVEEPVTKKEKEKKKEDIEDSEEDLFDLIDSLYTGKGEE